MTATRKTMPEQKLAVNRLDLKVLFSCNNHCLFCAQGHKRNCAPARSLSEVRAILARERKRGVKGVVFTGGEPTLYPQLPAAIAAARRAGYTEVQVQTNGRRLSYPDYCLKLKKAGMTEAAPALHGSTEEIHDGLTLAKGSFRQVVRGILNCARLGVPVVSNTVVTRRNFRDLPRLASLLLDLGVSHFQLSFVHPIGGAWNRRRSLVPRKSEALPFIREALKMGIRAGVSCCAEGIPPCLLPGMQKRVGDRVLQKGPVQDADVYIPHFGDFRREASRAKGPRCPECALFADCEGPWKEYPGLYGWDEFVPVKRAGRAQRV